MFSRAKSLNERDFVNSMLQEPFIKFDPLSNSAIDLKEGVEVREFETVPAELLMLFGI